MGTRRQGRGVETGMTHGLPTFISKEALAALPMRHYEGEIVFVDDEPALARARDELPAERVLGFDTETRPAFRKGESYLPSLVQIAGAQRVYIFALRRRDTHDLLRELLEAPAIVKTGVSVAYDLRTLAQVFAFEPGGIADVGAIAKRHGLEQTGVRNLAGLLLGFRVAKGAKTTNWAAPRLTESQINYAATDAWVCRELYLRCAALGWARMP